MNTSAHHGDQRELLTRAALAPGAVAREAFCRWYADNADRRHPDPIALRWLPLIAWNLRSEPLLDGERRYLRDIQRGLCAANLRLLGTTTVVLERLAEVGVRLMLLKGAALGLTVYEAPSGRPLGDIDVLVPPDQVATARQVLAVNGWRAKRSANTDDLIWCHATGWDQPSGGSLDLHWHLIPECCWPDADTNVWRRAQPIRLDGQSLLVPAPADQLLHVCVHGLRWSPVQSGHWIADAARIIRHDRAVIDWRVLIDEAGRRRLSFQVSEALRRVVAVGHTPVPDAVLRRLTATQAAWRERMECRVKERPVAGAGGMFLLWCGWRRACQAANGRGPGWLRYLAASVGVPSRWHLVPWAARHARARLTAIGGRLPSRRRLRPLNAP